MTSANRTELMTAVDELKGLKVDQIASLLQRRKIRGRPGTTGKCPLALHLASVHGGRFVVGQKYIFRQQGAAVDRIATPDNLAAFVRMFDSGKIQGLNLPPPRCLYKPTGKLARAPHRSKAGRLSRKPAAERLHLARDAKRFA